MATQLKLRRGSTTDHSTFTGAEGEITVDTTKDTVVVHDGATAGGVPLAKESAIPTGALASEDTVGTSEIDDNSITNAKMADDAVGIAELSATGTPSSSSYLRGDNTWATISADPTMGGDLSGTASNAQIVANAVGTTELANSSVTVAKISATGTASSTTYLRGDGQWATAGGGGSTAWKAVGTYITGRPFDFSQWTGGQTRSGSGLYAGPSNANVRNDEGDVGWIYSNQQNVGSGSWRCMSSTGANGTNRGIGLWVRYA